MKKMLLKTGIVFVLLSATMMTMSCEKDPPDPSTWTLIGTWEAEGEYTVFGDQRTYTSTLVFNEEDFTQNIHSKSKQGSFELTNENKGTYTFDDEKINFTYSYSSDYHDGTPLVTGGPFSGFSRTYKFINKNTLETIMLLPADYITSATFKRQ